jgi:hypothetical protein
VKNDTSWPASTEVRVPRSEKVAFILSQPAEMRAREVVARARKQGIRLTEQRVYAVRFLAKNARPPRLSKTDFVLRLPDELSAREVVAVGRENGVKLREPQVHNIRWAARRRQGLPKRRPGRRPGLPRPLAEQQSATPQRPTALPTTTRGLGELERELRHRIGELGIERSRTILAELGRTFAA